MTTPIVIDPNKAALLIMDYQVDTVAGYPEPQRTAVLERTGAALEVARAVGMLVVFVSVRLRAGYPDVSPRNKRSSAAKAGGRLQEGTQAVEIHPALAPRPGEPLVVKRRVGAFSYTDLELILNSHDVTTLVLCGLSTSGVVLSTVRAAGDMDYDLIVLEDCCADRQADIQEILMKKVFTTQAIVASSADFISALR